MTVKQTLEAKVDHYVWRSPDATDSRPKNLVLGLLRMAYVIVRDLRAGQLNLRAMGLVYTTLLSIVPLLALSLSVLKGFGVHNEVVPVLRDFFSPLGQKGDEIVDRIFEFVDNTRVGIEPRYLPGRPLDMTTLAAVVAAVRTAEEDGSLSFTARRHPQSRPRRGSWRARSTRRSQAARSRI